MLEQNKVVFATIQAKAVYRLIIYNLVAMWFGILEQGILAPEHQTENFR